MLVYRLQLQRGRGSRKERDGDPKGSGSECGKGIRAMQQPKNNTKSVGGWSRYDDNVAKLPTGAAGLTT